MPELMNIKELGKEVLTELEGFNKKIWDAISFRLIHAFISKELKNSYENVQEYRRQRWKKALAASKGDTKKAHQLISSEDFI